MKWLEPWRESWKNWVQWGNSAIAVIGGVYVLMTPEMKSDLPIWVVSTMAVLALANIFLRNIPQKNKRKE